MKERLAAAFDWTFRSRVTGRIVVAQFPNLSLGLFIAASVTRALLPSPSSISTGARWLAIAMLAWWAVDEIVRGVNPWRRVLGLIGAASVVGSVLSLVG